ncbi:MAG: hypothetical protein ABJA69_11275, partial [Acidobacteriaceae bacterium]
GGATFNLIASASTIQTYNFNVVAQDSSGLQNFSQFLSTSRERRGSISRSPITLALKQSPREDRQLTA